MATIEQLTTRIAETLQSGDPLPHVVKIDLKGAGFIHIDGAAVTNQDAPADLVVTISLDDVVALGRRRLDPMTALISRRMRMSDMSLAMSMQAQIQTLFAQAA
ncbi:SCP2 sterol-binding domain-containing protein [Phenylobacterium sp.]|uniref:SCP2 sterol-binding domain-containing protein n=1 Tax=Phenylobacterium sp. TaxID=1871053 RepID=UPI00272FF01A|nr:SCP2 sterol-binding domain-containing protein [Phenylobacterium sp.]MDP1873088.1 SCP2 sterol-binding domain-containing protein [Phenylobacterium sp.]MDP3490054.1 SCP2 sterol-binding domain-containing protein [Phenylobacterium sp.]